jgi:outer membrane protein assembly factor BamB
MTTPSEPLQTLTCPTCGAPLEIKVDEPTIHCQYCNANVENPQYHPPQPSAPPVFQVEYPTATSAPQKRSGGIRCFIVSIILLVVIGGGGLLVYSLISASGTVLSGASSLLTTPLQIHTPVILLNTGSTTPNVIASTYDVSSDRYSLSRLDMTNHKALWSALAQKDYLQIDTLLAGDTLVYVVMADRLVALQLSDGAQAWEASLPDKLPGACQTCVLQQKGQVVVLTTDGSLGAYDALTGHQTWEKHFDNTGDTLYPVGSGVGLVYSATQGSALGILDATSGDEVTHIEPTCTANDMTDQMENYSNVVFDLASQPAKVYFLFGLFNACVEGWDLSSGTLDWRYVEQDQNLDNSRDTPALLANNTLYYVQGDQLRSLDAATGKQTKTLDQPKDYSLVPLLVSGQRLLVRATRTQGTTRYELWGYDLASGKNLWKRPFINSAPMDPPDAMAGLIDTGDSAWTYQMTPGGLWLITFQAQPNQVNLAQVNLDTGELSNQQSLALGLDSTTDFYEVPNRIASQDPVVWFATESRIYALNPQTGKFVYQWP